MPGTGIVEAGVARVLGERGRSRLEAELLVKLGVVQMPSMFRVGLPRHNQADAQCQTEIRRFPGRQEP